MEYPHDPEALAAKERELADMERELNALKQKCIERTKDFSPTTRFAMTLAAQIIGYILLHILGGSVFSSRLESIAPGLDFINHSANYYLLISFAIPLLVGIHAYICRELKQFHVDIILLAYVTCDLVILLRLVCQQGGLCRSMFLPVFFLIPTAYMIAERREPKFLYRLRRVLVLMAIVGCICTSYHVSEMLMPLTGNGAGQPIAGKVHLLWWSIEVTDFSTLAHGSYDQALYIASMISAFVPITQIGIIMVRERFSGDQISAPPLFENYR
ncbi:MAG TPA: hypothetical protein VJ842_01595 [Pyrinomonadaceae bacterium]|nr:hypothetical protein [Pyrinomonadaceae bacterium]